MEATAAALKENVMKLQMRHQRLMKEHVDPKNEFDFGALKVATQIAIALVIALTMSTMIDGDDATLAAHAITERSVAAAPAAAD
jgi:hypothetical protein